MTTEKSFEEEEHQIAMTSPPPEDRSKLIAAPGPMVPLTPEENLMLEIFAYAIRDLLTPTQVLTPEERRTARSYFDSPDEGYIFSFGNLCNHFGFNKQQILGLIDKKRRGGTRWGK